jgi:hypothetical protein
MVGRVPCPRDTCCFLIQTRCCYVPPIFRYVADSQAVAAELQIALSNFNNKSNGPQTQAMH